MDQVEQASLRFLRTKSALVWNSICSEPLWTLYNLFAFIIHKDLKATVLHLTVLNMLRPLVYLFSMYWSAAIVKRPERLLGNVLWAGVLSRLPFFFFPFIDNPWILIASVALYVMLSRGGVPAWMEILKQNLPGEKRGFIFSYSSAFAYAENVVLAIGIGYFLDHHPGSWRWMFPASALVGMAGVFLQARIPLECAAVKKAYANLAGEGKGLSEFILTPWKSAWELLKNRRDFSKFQIGFTLGIMGIMVVQPALPIYFIDVLGMSYIEMAIAISLCKGVGYALTSPFWGKLFYKVDIYRLSSWMFLCMLAQPLFLLFAPASPLWVLAGYTLYGVAQAGCHPIWNLSGLSFAKEEESALFSSVNLLSVGVRGCVIPPLGSALLAGFGPVTVLAFGSICCVFGSLAMMRFGHREVSLAPTAGNLDNSEA